MYQIKGKEQPLRKLMEKERNPENQKEKVTVLSRNAVIYMV